ncbi:MAG: T9SS type A sorting domain-containing protein [Bacteroidia bacterium]
MPSAKVKSTFRTFFFLCMLLTAEKECFSAPVNYYVNDLFTTGDIFCTHIGDPSYNGLTPATPAASLYQIWNTYGPAGTNVLKSSDNIYIDAGTYKNLHDYLYEETIPGLSFIGAGPGLTIFDDNWHGGDYDYFMTILASNVHLQDFSLTHYENLGTADAATSFTGQALTLGDGTGTYSGIVIDNIDLYDNGSSAGNGVITVLDNVSATIQNGGGMCNAPGTAYTGGISVIGKSINLQINSYVIGNNSKSQYFGGGLYIQGDNTTLVTLKGCRITNNLSTDGGGILSTGNLVIYDCIIEDNTSSNVGGSNGFGGGICIAAGKFWMSRSIIQNNTATSSAKGGGLYIGYNSGYVKPGSECPSCATNTAIVAQIDSCSFTGNTATNGKDLYMNSGTLNSTDNSFASAATSVYVNAGSVNVDYSGSPTTSGTITFAGGTGHSAARYTGPGAAYLPAATGIPSFTGTCPSTINILPVELVSWYGVCAGNGVDLHWTTASETNNESFLLERSADGVLFETIAKLAGAGNNSHAHSYTYTYLKPPSGSCYYRLSQADYNGRMTVFNIILVRNFCNADKASCLSVFPNPTSSLLTLEFELEEPGQVTYEIYNCPGQLLETVSEPFLSSGFQSLTINVSHLAPGSYYIRLKSNGGCRTKRFIRL